MLARVEREHLCDLCDGTGTMTWQQPVPGPDGALMLAEIDHPCVNGCSGWFRVPAAELVNVIDPSPADSTAAGNVARANSEHRTEWSRPLPSPAGRHYRTTDLTT